MGQRHHLNCTGQKVVVFRKTDGGYDSHNKDRPDELPEQRPHEEIH